MTGEKLAWTTGHNQHAFHLLRRQGRTNMLFQFSRLSSYEGPSLCAAELPFAELPGCRAVRILTGFLERRHPHG